MKPLELVEALVCGFLKANGYLSHDEQLIPKDIVSIIVKLHGIGFKIKLIDNISNPLATGVVESTTKKYQSFNIKNNRYGPIIEVGYADIQEVLSQEINHSTRCANYKFIYGQESRRWEPFIEKTTVISCNKNASLYDIKHNGILLFKKEVETGTSYKRHCGDDQIVNDIVKEFDVPTKLFMDQIKKNDIHFFGIGVDK